MKTSIKSFADLKTPIPCKGLTAERVNTVFMSCLFSDAEPRPKEGEYVAAKGVTMNIGFHPGRLKAAKPEIKELLSCLPDEFMASKGGGMSFLKACYTRDEQALG